MDFCPLECGLRVKSFYTHISRCKKKDLLGKEYVKCKYNYNHIVKKELIDKHLEECGNK